MPMQVVVRGLAGDGVLRVAVLLRDGARRRRHDLRCRSCRRSCTSRSGVVVPATSRRSPPPSTAPASTTDAVSSNAAAGVWSTGVQLSDPGRRRAVRRLAGVEVPGRRQQEVLFDRSADLQRAPTTAGPIKVVTLTGRRQPRTAYSLAAGTQTIDRERRASKAASSCSARERDGDAAAHRRKPHERRRVRRAGGREFRGRDHQRLSDAVPDQRRRQSAPIRADPPSPRTASRRRPGASPARRCRASTSASPSCPPYNWPNYDPDDPRVVPLMITDFSALGGSGIDRASPSRTSPRSTSRGWTGSTCGNEPAAALRRQEGRDLGPLRQVRRARPECRRPPDDLRPRPSVTPCVPVMTR